MDIDFGILKNIFTKKEDVKDNLTSTDTNKPLSARQGKILNETKISSEDYLYIDTVDAEITYDDDSTDTLPILTDIREVNGIQKVAIVWKDSYNKNSTRPSSVTVELLRDGVSIDYSGYVLNSNNNWQYKVNVPLDNGEGHSYSYEWRVNAVTGYFSSNTTDGNLCIITLTLLGGGDVPPTPGEGVPRTPIDSEDVPERP